MCSVSSLFLVNNVQEDAKWVCRVEFSAIHISIAIRTASLAWSVQGEAASSHCLSVPLHSAVVLICTFWSNLNWHPRTFDQRLTINAATVHVKWNTVTDFNRVKTPCYNSLWYSFASILWLCSQTWLPHIGLFPWDGCRCYCVCLVDFDWRSCYCTSSNDDLIQNQIWSAVKDLLMCKGYTAHGEVSPGLDTESEKVPCTANAGVNTEL